jgi:hypothetical protein
MTPGAAQVAAFQKDGGTDAWTVIGTEFLDIEYGCCGRKMLQIHGSPPVFSDFILA